MADVQIWVTVSDELLERIREAELAHDDEALDLLWEDAETEVVDSIRARFSPTDLT